MVQSLAGGVDEYLMQLLPDRRPQLERLRAIARRTLRGFEEGMEYGMPYYRKSATQGVGFASQRHFIGLYAGEEVLKAHRKELAGLDLGRGCVRFTRTNDIDWELVQRLFDTVARQ